MTKLELRKIAATIAPTDFSSATAYLAAVYKELKAQIPGYSYVRFSQDLGFGDCNVMCLIINGHRKLTDTSAQKICAALDLTGAHRKYFLAASKTQRALSADEREEAFNHLVKLNSESLSKVMEQRQLEFFNHWHNAAILELLGLENSSDDPAWLATRLMPSVSPGKVKSSLELLKKLGLIVRDKDKGRWIPTQAETSSGGAVPGLAIIRYHQQMISLAKDALTDVPAAKRDISAVTISIPAAKIEHVKQRIAAFRRELMDFARSESGADEVLQVNVQVFPIGQISARSKRDETP